MVRFWYPAVQCSAVRCGAAHFRKNQTFTVQCTVRCGSANPHRTAPHRKKKTHCERPCGLSGMLCIRISWLWISRNTDRVI